MIIGTGLPASEEKRETIPPNKAEPVDIGGGTPAQAPSDWHENTPMADPAPKSRRRLAVVVAVDVVGSSRLMEQDEPGTLAAIHTVFSDIIEPAAARHQGRLVKTMGDGALLEFASPVEAVLCAVEAQAAVGDLPGRRLTRERGSASHGDQPGRRRASPRTTTFSGIA